MNGWLCRVWAWLMRYAQRKWNEAKRQEMEAAERLSPLERLTLSLLSGRGGYMSTVDFRTYLAVVIRPPNISALFDALDSLEAKGFVQSFRAPGGPERGYRRKRLCQVTEAGRAKVKEIQEKR